MATFSSLPDPWDESSEQLTPEDSAPPAQSQSDRETQAMPREISDAPELDTDLFRDVLVDINSVFPPSSSSPPPTAAMASQPTTPQAVETADAPNLTDRISKFEPLALDEPLDETLTLLDMPLADLQATFGIGRKTDNPKTHRRPTRTAPLEVENAAPSPPFDAEDIAGDRTLLESPTETAGDQEITTAPKTQLANPDPPTPQTTLASSAPEQVTEPMETPGAETGTATTEEPEPPSASGATQLLNVESDRPEPEPTDGVEDDLDEDDLDDAIAQPTIFGRVDTALNILKSLFQLGSQPASDPAELEEPEETAVAAAAESTAETATGEPAVAEPIAPLPETILEETVPGETVPEPAAELVLEPFPPEPIQSAIEPDIPAPDRPTPDRPTPHLPTPAIANPTLTQLSPASGRKINRTTTLASPAEPNPNQAPDLELPPFQPIAVASATNPQRTTTPPPIAATVPAIQDTEQRPAPDDGPMPTASPQPSPITQLAPPVPANPAPTPTPTTVGPQRPIAAPPAAPQKADPAAGIPFPEEDDILTVLGSATSAIAPQKATSAADDGFTTIGLVGEEAIAPDVAASKSERGDRPDLSKTGDRPSATTPSAAAVPAPLAQDANGTLKARRSPLVERRLALEAQLEEELQAFWEVTQPTTATDPTAAAPIPPVAEPSPTPGATTRLEPTSALTSEAIATPPPQQPTPSERLNRPSGSTRSTALNRLSPDFTQFFSPQTQPPEDPLADIRQYLRTAKEQPDSASSTQHPDQPQTTRPPTVRAEPATQTPNVQRADRETGTLEAAALAALGLEAAALGAAALEQPPASAPTPPTNGADPADWDLDTLAAALSEPPSARLAAETTEPPRYTPVNLPPFKRFEAIETKLNKLERQVYEPTDVINPLLPLIAQLLKMRLGTTQEAVREMATPILDQMIQERALQNRDAMAQALSSVIPDAISQEIQANPQRVAKAIGPEVGAAIKEQIRLERDAISESLGPTIGRAIKTQIAVERDSMVDALYPVIGSTVSRYMGEVLNTINDKVESTLSIDGIGRKIRARVQGVSEAELILRESMPTTVQAMFLIHKTSGLVIAEVQPRLEQRLESNMIAGMLTAIRSFVNDCIAQTGEITELNEIEYGDSRIVLEVAGYCYLAVVAKGQIPKPFRERLRKVFGQITQSHGRYIEDFEGDMDTVPPDITLTLKKLGDEQNRLAYEQASKPRSPKTLFILLGLLAAAILLPLLYFQIRGFFNNRLSRQIEAALAQELDPVAFDDIEPTVRGRNIRLEGRVPSATAQARATEITQAIAPRNTIDNAIQVVQTSDPTEAATSLQVITSLLNRESGIDIQTEYSAETVTVSGIYQSPEAQERIQQTFDTLPGIPPVNYQGLIPQLLLERIYFETGVAAIAPAELASKVEPLAQFLTNNPDAQLRLIGHTDPRGEEANNQALADSRAQAVGQALVQAGVDAKQLAVVGSLENPPGIAAGQPLRLYRCVRFELIQN